MDGFAHYAAETGATVLTAADIGGLTAPVTEHAAPAGSRQGGDPQGLDEALASLARTAPVVVCFDKPQDREAPHWRGLLEATRRRLRKHPVMLVLTLLPFGGCEGDVHCDLLRQPNLHRIRLGLLDREQTRALCEDLHARPLDGELCDTLHSLSGGSPLLVRALAEELDMQARADLGAPWPYPRGLYAQVAADCVRLSGPWAETVALGMGALREFSDLTSLTAVLPLEAPEIVRGMTLLREAGLVDGWRLRHPVMEAAVLEQAGPDRRDEVLLRTAERLRESGAGARVTARYLLEIGHVRESWQTAALQRAADEALALDDTAFAVACVELAQASTTDCWERARLTLKRSVVLLRTEPWRVEQLYLEKSEWPECAHGANCCPARTVLTALLLIGCGRLEEGTTMLRGMAPPAVDRSEEDPWPDHFDEGWPWFFCLTPGIPDAWALRMSSERTACGEGHFVGGQVCADGVAIQVCVNRHHVRPRAVHEIEEHLGAWTLGDTTLALIVPELRHLTAVGRPDLADAWCERFQREAAERGVEGWRQLFTALRAESCLARGRPAEAEAHAREVMELGGDAPSHWLCGGVLTVLVAACTASGQYEEAVRLLDRPVPDGFFRSAYGLDYLRARGQFLLAVGRPHLALSDFLAVGRYSERWEPALRPRSTWRIDAAEAWLALGNVREAEQLLDAHEKEAGSDSALATGQWLRVRAQLAEVCERPGLLTRAAEHSQASGNAWELARVLVDLAEACQDLGQSARADLTLRKARQLADECGSVPLRDRIALLGLADGRQVLRAAGEPLGIPSPAAKLSDSERRVAVLAARGMTNREISTELFITVSTVEQHLTRVYKKLDITSRQELPLHIELGLPESA
ncbi:LuxR C-terminal-related transcriptional regulator [Streptomyces sp. MB09-02B]|uniref:LuxR C-terminal-related transcriptional regulator n=1 Tax=Streptomyces sp. MB09-02B TaxID=3028667 RepID=UPI0029B1FE0A|nr:LuxR C-terminal-related transcriptional regulator [Streptomyces sp. MB09-02B]MDX3642557.1 LuxR C-terminal-related transcriptional regulator [Streptomyces sp. MB09-02B]